MASKSLGVLTLDLVAKIGGFTGPLDRAERQSKKSTSSMSKDVKNFALAAAAAGAAVAAGFAVMVRQQINVADEMSKASQAVGVNISELSALAHAADLSGVSFEELRSSLNRFNRTNSDAFAGIGLGAKAYERLGIQVKNVDGSLKSNTELISDVAEAFSKMEGGAQKSAIAQDLFGRAGAKLIPLLNAGRDGIRAMTDEAQRLGLVIGEQAGRDAERFNDNLRRMQLVFVGLARTVAGEVVGPMADFTDTIADPEFQSGLAAIATGIINIGTAAANSIKFLTGFGAVLGEEIARITGGIDASNIDDIYDQIDEVQKLIDNPSLRIRFFGKNGIVEYFNEAELKTEMDKLIAQRDAILRSSPPPPVAVPAQNDSSSSSWNEVQFLNDVASAAEGAAKSNKKLNDQYEQQLAAYREQIALSGEMTELDKIRYSIANGSLVGINAEQQKRLESLASEIDAVAKLRMQEQERAQAQIALASDLESVRSQLLTQEEALTEASLERAQTLKSALDAGKLTEDEYSAMIQRNTDLLDESIDRLKTKTTELDEFTKNAARSIQNELSNALVAGFDGGSDDLLKRWGDMLKRMIADAVAADIARSLFGQSSDGQYGTAQMMGGLGSFFAGFFDSGGNIPSGKFGIVGERGPELVSGPATVTGRRDTAAMMGGSNVSIGNLVFPGVTNAREAEMAAGAAGRKIMSIVSGSQRYA